MMNVKSKLLSILLIFSPAFGAAEPQKKPELKHPTPRRDLNSLTEAQKAAILQRRSLAKQKEQKEIVKKERLYRQEQMRRQNRQREEYYNAHPEENE